MIKPRFKVIHILILMTSLAVVITGYLGIQRYRYHKTLEAYEQLAKEVFAHSDALLALDPENSPADLWEFKAKTEQFKALKQRAIELDKKIDKEDSERIFEREKNEWLEVIERK